jgi:sugar lactone lactonase YvrE
MVQHQHYSFALATAVLLASACQRSDEPDDTPPASQPATSERAAPFTISDIGLAKPESVLYDEQADIYLVSNINGQEVEHDDNGFVTRIRPDGSVEALHWIDGARADVTLHAPKGMALLGDTLFVADIDSVRAFHRTSGAQLGARGVPGATFLNDLAVGANGVLYITDSGLDASFKGTGTDAIHRFDANGVTSFASGGQLKAPNGLWVEGDSVYMVPFGTNTVWVSAASGGTPATLATLPAGQLDGVVRLRDGSLLVSSWEGKAVYRVSGGGQVSTVVENVESPADIGWDSRRNRVLIPIFGGDVIEVREIL